MFLASLAETGCRDPSGRPLPPPSRHADQPRNCPGGAPRLAYRTCRWLPPRDPDSHGGGDYSRQPVLAAAGHGLVDSAPAESRQGLADLLRSEEHTSELQSLMRISYAVFCLKKK